MVILAPFSVFERKDDIMAAFGISDNMTEAEYIEALNGLSDEIFRLQAKTDGIDADDTEGAKAYLDELKAPFDAFAAIDTPPKAFAEGHVEIQSGCRAMTEYLDVVKSIVGETDEEKLASAADLMVVKLTDAMDKLSRGTDMVEEAAK